MEQTDQPAPAGCAVQAGVSAANATAAKPAKFPDWVNSRMNASHPKP